MAFREKNPFVELGGSSSLAEAVAGGQERFLAAIDGIERGEFPPDPDEPYRLHVVRLRLGLPEGLRGR